jgi:hypothetical protein
MGGGSYSADAWATYSATVSHKTVNAIFKSTSISTTLNPKGVAIRESRDSTEHPESTAIIVGIDVTGSMGMLAETIAKKGLGVLFQEILDRKPVTDPQLMFMAIGDAVCDQAPLQVSQFESDNRIVDQLEQIWIEHGGGGNSSESYDFPWYFGAMHTSIDCFDKRGKKGYLFTIGDEESPYGLTSKAIERFIGDTPQADYSAAELLMMVERKYHVFHIIVEEGSHCRHSKDAVFSSWANLLGQRALHLSDHTKLAETIVSAIQITEGADKKAVVDSWDGTTSVVVGKAINGLSAVGAPTDGVVSL